MKKDREREVIFNLPNILTTFRLLCIPLVVICLRNPGRLGSFFAALFFGLAFITDILDGFFARRYCEITRLGKLLDPLADKILVGITMVMLIPLGRIPIWIVMLILAREIAVTGLRSIAVNRGILIQANTLGKYKTAFQVTSTIALCLHYKYFNADFHVIGMIFLWIALTLTLWSGGAYFWQFRRVLFPKKGDK